MSLTKVSTSMIGGSGQAQAWTAANGAINWLAGASYIFSFTTQI